jgi:NAD(P)-dependent dehydrogenase (short-subunit alcohol dehydrogenase family)
MPAGLCRVGPRERLPYSRAISDAFNPLCSEEANWITGQVIEVDGGASLMDAHLPLEIQQAVPTVAKAT